MSPLAAISAGGPIPRQASRAPAELRAAWRRDGLHTAETIGDLLRRGVEQYGDTKIIFASDSRPNQTTLADAHREAQRVAAGLYALGLRRGDRIALQVPHWIEAAHVACAAFSLGLVVVPIVHIYGPAELGFILRQTGARALVTPDRWRSIDFSARLDGCGALPALLHVIVIGDGPFSREVTRWPDLARDDTPAPFDPPDPADVALIVFTSGTTASPKGAQHTHETIGAEIRSFKAFADVRARLPFLVSFPAGHVAGLYAMLRPFQWGMKTVFLDQWNPQRAVEAIREHDVAWTAGTPFHLIEVLEAAGGPPAKSFHSHMLGGASVPPSAIRLAAENGIGGFRCYGSTEHPTISTGLPEMDEALRGSTDGLLFPGCTVRLVDDDGRDVPVGQPGEILSQGPELMVGYLDPALNDDSFAPGGWFRTGDIGVMNAEGYLTIVDRKKDMIIRGGENISSKEVEDVLQRHPAVAEAAVVGWPDRKLGERVAVFVRVQPGQSIDLDAVRAHFQAAGLARQKTPEHVIVVEDFPRTPSGKVKKTELRKDVAERAKAHG